MDQIVVRTKIDEHEARHLIERMYHIVQTHPQLSPRSKIELQKAYNDGCLCIARKGSHIIGWLLRIPYEPDIQELAAAYVDESYQSQGVFTKLLYTALKEAPVSISVTFNHRLFNFLVQKVGFRKSSFWEVLKISKGKFLLNRINPARLRAIKKHYQEAKPMYLIFKNI